MGGRGTEVARQAADLVLLDDDLATLIVAVGEGRRIHANIRSFLRFGLGGGLAEVLVLLCAPLLGWPVPLTPAMILWVNMLTHGLPGVAFGGEPLDPALMSRPSPSPDRSVLDRQLSMQVLQGGTLVTLACLAAGWWAGSTGSHVPTSVFVTLGLSQLGLALALRSPRRGWRLHERWLEVAVAGAVVAQTAAVLLPGLAGLLGAELLPLSQLVVLVALASAPGLVTAVVDRAHTGPRSRG
jgi:Ca2+-transporting ATPase